MTRFWDWIATAVTVEVEGSAKRVIELDGRFIVDIHGCECAAGRILVCRSRLLDICRISKVKCAIHLNSVTK